MRDASEQHHVGSRAPRQLTGPSRRSSRSRPRAAVYGALTAGVLAVALVACGDDAPQSSAALHESLGDETCKFTVGMLVDIDPAKVADHAALDAMREDGCAIELQQLAETELVAEGVVQNRFQLGSSGSAPFFILSQKNQPVVGLLETYGNDSVVMGEKGIDGCEGVHEAGSFAIPSMGSAMAALGQYWFNTNCPGLEPPFVAVPGGPERAQALLSGHIATSIAQLSDAVVVTRSAPDEIDYVANFSVEMPEIVTMMTFANADWVAENPNTVKLFLRHRLEVNRQIASDPDYYRELLDRYDAEVDPQDVDATVELLATPQIFDPNGGVEENDLALTVEAFVGGGALDAEPAVDVGDLIARDLLDEVLDEIGRE